MVEAHGPWCRALLAAAGVLGASGVMVGAASAHLGGGALGQLASTFLLLHAAAIPGIVAVPAGSVRARAGAGSLMALGAMLFSGDLAVLAFTGRTPVAGMAPVGGLLLIGSWLAFAGVAWTGTSRRSGS